MGKKRKNVDFQKVKLRVGRRLPKGNNVTDTTFKSKKIVIRDQLKQQDEDSGAPKKLTLKELLRRVEHHNVTIRRDSLSQIKDNITQHKETFTTDLAEILETVIKVLRDSNPVVRKAAINVIRLVLQLTSYVQMGSFVPLITAHLCCAMTHIDNDIRRDSLLIVDIILETQPYLICHSTTILNNFLEHISGRSMNKSKKKNGHLKRLLYVAPDDKITSQEWRVQVLKRILKFLKAIVKKLKGEKNLNEDEMPEVKWDVNNPQCIPLYAHGGLKPVIYEYHLNIHPLSVDGDRSTRNASTIKDFVSDLMPLLFDTWKEETAENFSSSQTEGPLSPTAAVTMSLTLQVICCIGEWITLLTDSEGGKDMVKWFKENYDSLFCSKFMKQFPYSRHQVIGRKKLEMETKATCVQLNLAICSLYSAFVIGTQYATEEHTKSVQKYFLEITRMDSCEGLRMIPVLLKIAKHFLQNDSSEIATHEYLSDLHKLSQRLHPSNQNRGMIVSFFADLSLDPKNRHLIQGPLTSWLSSLIDEMKCMAESKIVDKKVLSTIRKICARQYPPFMESLQENCEELLKLLLMDDESLQTTVSDLIVNVTCISSEFLQELATVLRKPSVSVRSNRYIVQHLTYRLLTSKSSGLTLHALVMFLFNLTTGVIVNEEHKLSDHGIEAFSASWQIAAPLLTYTIQPSKVWQRHSKIIEFTIESLLHLPNHENISMYTFYFLKQFLTTCPTMPIHCALALFQLKDRVAYYQGYQCQDKELLICFIELTMACLVYGKTLTSATQDEECYDLYGVVDMFTSLNLNRSKVLDIVNLLKMKMPLVQNSVLGFHVSTMLLILSQKNFLKPDDLNILSPILKALKDNLGDKFKNERWWINLYSFFSV